MYIKGNSNTVWRLGHPHWPAAKHANLGKKTAGQAWLAKF